MKAIYQQVVDDIDARIARLEETRAAVLALGGSNDEAIAARPRSERGAPKKKRRAKSAADELVLEVIRDGADTMTKIADAAKVKPYSASQAIKRLVAAKRVRFEGATKLRRYLVGPKT